MSYILVIKQRSS